MPVTIHHREDSDMRQTSRRAGGNIDRERHTNSVPSDGKVHTAADSKMGLISESCGQP